MPPAFHLRKLSDRAAMIAIGSNLNRDYAVSGNELRGVFGSARVGEAELNRGGVSTGPSGGEVELYRAVCTCCKRSRTGSTRAWISATAVTERASQRGARSDP